MTVPIVFKEFYNIDRGLIEPKWGPEMSNVSRIGLQCPTCGSQDIYGSASPDDPEEIFPFEMARCGHCGHITDWYEACKQYRYHRTRTPREVVRQETNRELAS